MSSGIERALEHPLFAPRNTNDGTGPFRGHSIHEFVVVGVIDQAVLCVDQDPAELSGARSQNGLCNTGIRDPSIQTY